MRSSGDGMPARFEQRDRLVARLRLGEAAVAHQHLDDLIADGVARIERGHRLLEDHRDAVAAQVAQLAVRQVEQTDAVEASLRRRLRPSPWAAGPSRRAKSRSCRSRIRRRARASSRARARGRRRRPRPCGGRDRRETPRAGSRSPAAARASLRLGERCAAMRASSSARSMTPTGSRLLGRNFAKCTQRSRLTASSRSSSASGSVWSSTRMSRSGHSSSP